MKIFVSKGFIIALLCLLPVSNQTTIAQDGATVAIHCVGFRLGLATDRGWKIPLALGQQ